MYQSRFEWVTSSSLVVPVTYEWVLWDRGSSSSVTPENLVRGTGVDGEARRAYPGYYGDRRTSRAAQHQGSRYGEIRLVVYSVQGAGR